MTGPKQELFLENDSSPEEAVIRINHKFATAYENRKQKQELQHENENDDSSSSSDESEDEDGNLLTATMDVSILKTINALRNKDEIIYDPSTRFFPEEEGKEDSSNDANNIEERKQKPKHFKDVIREQILEQINMKESSSKERQKEETLSKLEYDEEQRALRSAFIMDDSTTQNDDNDEDWIVLKQKTENKEVEQEADRLLEQELKVFQQTNNNDNDNDQLQDPHGQVEDGKEFLIDFIKNKKWIDRTERVDQNDSEDDSIQELDRTDDFESQYNFRFEQAASTSGADHSMISYSRGADSKTLRRKDETRRLKRLQQKETKAAKRKAKEEQLRRLKNAKRQEMQQRLQQIKNVLDQENNVMDEATMMKLMEGDYDETKFEEIMNQAYNDEFYQQKDQEWKTDGNVRESLKHDDDGAMLVGEDDADGGMYDNYDGEENQDDNNDDDWDSKMDADDNNEDDNDEYGFEPEKQETEAEKKLKKKMMDELYKLDYEDIVAGMPTRFKYRTVEPNNFGLSTQEILFARDTTLKQFVSLKKMAPYREEGEYHVTGKKRRRFRELVRHEMEEEMQKDGEEHGESTADGEETAGQTGDHDQPKKKRRRQKKGKKKDAVSNGDVSRSVQLEGAKGEVKVDAEERSSKRRRKKKGSKKQQAQPPFSVQVNDKTGESDQHQVLGEDGDVLERSVDSSQGNGKDKDAPLGKKEHRHKDREIKKKKKKKRRKNKPSVEGVSASRLASYGL